MSDAAQAYARTANTIASPREVEARALLKAAKQLQDVVNDWAGADERMRLALLFNRKLWAIFMSAAVEADNPLAREIREKVANVGIFVMTQTRDMQLNPDPRKLLPLININLNLAAGLSGRA